MVHSFLNKRRWQRYSVELPVGILVWNGRSQNVMCGLCTKISEGGMLLYAEIPLQAGDLTEIEFEVSKARRTAIIRNRTGYFFGLEFAKQLPI
jgi:hypothetical protein